MSRPHSLVRDLYRALPLVALGAMACDPYVKVSGVVRDVSGAPLGDVIVTLQTNGRQPDNAKTGSDGRFDVSMVGADPQRTVISFHKDGFKALERAVGEDERQTLDVTLTAN